MSFHTTVPFFEYVSVGKDLPIPTNPAWVVRPHYIPQGSHTFKPQFKYQLPYDAFQKSLMQFTALSSILSLYLVHNDIQIHIPLIVLSLERLFPPLNATTWRAKFRGRGAGRERLRERSGQVTKNSSIGKSVFISHHSLPTLPPY